ncbi:MAG: WbqC family protein [Bacteroidetes bacterium]|nr:WbqC family protein [Bacteroidota bacterium]MBK8658875.1 WbqC family protein [Bacteroidota bacterium]
MKKVAILQSNYIPWKGYFDLIKSVDVFVIYDEVQYTKNDWRNRNLIKTPTGPSWITIPCRQTSLAQKIYETQVTLPNWNVKHWNTIKGNYTRAPYFKKYEEVFYQTYMSSRSEFLSEINLTFIKTINGLLGIETTIIDSRELNLQGDKNERLIEAVCKLNGNYYLSGPAAKSYLDEKAFHDKGIEVAWMDYTKYPEYQQLYPPFTHGVSILDLIFNCGESAVNYF